MNKYLIEYSLNSLLRNKTKNIFIFFIFSFLIWIISSIFFISNSIKHELNKTVEQLPQITIQQLQGGRIVNIDTYILDDIIQITGVKEAQGRVWGYYYYDNAGVNFTIVGIDNFENQYTNSLQKIIEDKAKNEVLDNDKMLVGSGVDKILKENFFNGYFNFILDDGSFKKIDVQGVFDSNLQLQSNDMILLSKDLAREVLNIPEEKYSDIVVKVSNPVEIATIAQKIKYKYPNTRVVTNEDYKVSYQNMFDYKSGLFLALFITSLSAFFIIVYDKASGLTSHEKKEIGILKALGWSVSDVLKEKFYESFLISFFSYIVGISISFFYVYILHAPLLRNIFEGYSKLKTSFELPFIIDFQTLSLVFFITIPLYIAATIIPSWKASIMDADDIIR